MTLGLNAWSLSLEILIWGVTRMFLLTLLYVLRDLAPVCPLCTLSPMCARSPARPPSLLLFLQRNNILLSCQFLPFFCLCKYYFLPGMSLPFPLHLSSFYLLRLISNIRSLWRLFWHFLFGRLKRIRRNCSKWDMSVGKPSLWGAGLGRRIGGGIF